MRTIAMTFCLMIFGILPAAAQEVATDAAGQQPQGSFASFIIFWGVILGIFYFILIRPQHKRVKKHRNLVESLNKGDEVVTSGGLMGKITAVHDTFIELQVAKNTTVKVMKFQVARHQAKEQAAEKDSEKE